MGYFVNLRGLRPGKRNDGNKWTHARVYEMLAATGARTQIENIALADYPDPLAPPVFMFTTVNASAPSGLWYLVEFRDLVGGIQESTPEFNASGLAAVPTVEWVRDTSNIAFGEFGYPVPEDGESDRLAYVLDEAVIEFQAITGIDLATVAADDRRISLIHKALRMFVEYNAARSQPEILDTAVDFDLVQSMNADGYSETRRSLSQNTRLVHPWPALAVLLGLIGGMDDDGVVDPDAEQVDGPGLVTMGREPRPYDHVQPPADLVDVSGVYWPRTGYQPDGFEG